VPLSEQYIIMQSNHLTIVIGFSKFKNSNGTGLGVLNCTHKVSSERGFNFGGHRQYLLRIEIINYGKNF